MRALVVIALIFVTGLAVGAIAVVSWTSPDSHRSGLSGADTLNKAAPVAPSADQIERNPQLIIEMYDSLAAIVNEERIERLRLEEELLRVTAELADLEGNLSTRVSESYAEQQAQSDDEASVAVAGIGNRASIEQRLIDAGFDPMTAADLQRRMDGQQMDQLYLRDQATREGWINTGRYRSEARNLQNIQNDIRSELNESDYDRFLYASGQPNRIGVASVLETSPAKKAGLQPGDTLLSYNGQRIFNVRELIRVSTQGESGTTVVLEVLRNGQKTALYVPRGPLGFNPTFATVDPDS